MKKIFMLILIVFSVNLYAAPTYEGKIRAFYINKGKTVLLRLDSPAPECSDVNWPFQFSLDDPSAKEWVSMLLMSRASETSIKIGFIPNANGRCGIEYLYYYD